MIPMHIFNDDGLKPTRVIIRAGKAVDCSVHQSHAIYHVYVHVIAQNACSIKTTRCDLWKAIFMKVVEAKERLHSYSGRVRRTSACTVKLA